MQQGRARKERIPPLPALKNEIVKNPILKITTAERACGFLSQFAFLEVDDPLDYCCFFKMSFNFFFRMVCLQCGCVWVENWKYAEGKKELKMGRKRRTAYAFFSFYIYIKK